MVNKVLLSLMGIQVFSLSLFILAYIIIMPILLYLSFGCYLISIVILINYYIKHDKSNTTYIIFTLLILFLIPTVINQLLPLNGGFFKVLTWDYKAMINVANYIVSFGREPFNIGDPNILRPAYTSYPIYFTLLAILSMVINVPVNIIFQTPLISSLYFIILLYYSLSILRYNVSTFSKMISLLLPVFILFINYDLSYMAIYQNFGRVILLLLLFLVFKNTYQYKSENIIMYFPLYIILIFFVVSLIMAHSSSSIDFQFFAIGLLLSILLRRRLTVNHADTSTKLTFVVLIGLIFFLFYQLWLSQLFTIDLIQMLHYTIFTFLSNPNEASPTVKFTPINYTSWELMLIIYSVIFISAILLWSIVLGFKMIIKKRDIPYMLFPLLMVSLFALIMLFSPYKSDIALKFINIGAISFSLLMVELDPSKYLKNKRLYYLLIALLILFLIGLFALSSFPHASPSLNKKYNYVAIELESTYPLVKTSSVTNIVFIDTPQIPYFVFRDFIIPRLGSKDYIILFINASNLHYSYVQENGIPEPRFILRNATTFMPNNSIIMVGKPCLLTTLLMNNNIILNANEFCLFYK